MTFHSSESTECFALPSSPCSTATTFSRSSRSSTSNEKVLVYELDTQRTKKCRRGELELTKSGNDQYLHDFLCLMANAELQEFVQTEPKNLTIKPLQRWVEIVIKGDERTHEASTRVAYARVPITVMVQRAFGEYTELRVTSRI